ncbi:MAG TPA: helix-turn-helix domain-containing protein [Kofleriaceae bacterium]|nr:helix-turn-helix domain-containing protein [Kofleriaceae bacterium]
MPLPVRRNKVSSPLPACPVTTCMTLLGGAWAPNVIWYLSAHPRRFGELRIDIPKISARVLSARLRELESKGVVARRVMPTSPPSVEYELTELGRELLPAIQAIIAVGAKLVRRSDQVEPAPRRRGATRAALTRPASAAGTEQP